MATRIEAEFTRRADGSLQMTMAEDGRKGLIWNRMKPKPERVRFSDYTGAYKSPELNTEYVVKIAGDNLVIEAAGITHRLTAEFADAFSTPAGTTIWFTRDKRQRIVGYTLSTGRANGLIFERTSTREPHL